MPSISIQFHALPSELALFVEGWLSEMNLHAIAVTFPPWAARGAAPEELRELILRGPCADIVLCEEPPSLPIRTQTELYQKHPAALTIIIGRQGQRGLKESALSCGTDGPPISAKWKKIARNLRAATEAGLTATDPKTGASAYYTNHRYTPGAKALSDAGVPILPLAGGALYKLGKRDTR